MDNYSLTWDLNVLYAGGSDSSAFAEELSGMETDIVKLTSELQSAVEPSTAAPRTQSKKVTLGQLSAWTASVQSILIRLRQVDSFVACLLAQNMKDSTAQGLNDRVKTMAAKFNSALTSFDEQLRLLNEAEWNEWIKQEDISPVVFILSERREAAKEKLPPSQEALAGELAVDGYHGWGDLYNTIVSRARFQAVNEDGTTKTLSAGQMHNRLSDPDRKLRESAFAEWEREWGEQAELCAETLNRISGFRLKLYGSGAGSRCLKNRLRSIG